MKTEIINYIKYGIFNNTIYFPYNKKTIEEYIKELKPLAKLIEKSYKDEIYENLYKERPNIFITSYILCNTGLTEKSYEFLKNQIKERMDIYIFLTFAYYSSKIEKKYINLLYKDKIHLISDYKNLCFDLFKPNLTLSSVFKKRDKVIKKVRKDMELLKINQETINLIKNFEIHFKELSPCMSYYFDQHKKIELTKYFVDKYGILEVISFIEGWFIENIPDDIINYFESKIYNLNKIEDIEELLIIYKTLNDIRLKSLIEKAILNYIQNKNNNLKISINVIPTLKHKYKIDKREKFDYLYFNGVNAALLDLKFDSVLYINKSLINGDILSKIYRIDGNDAVLKPEAIVKEDRCNILFSNIEIERFNVIWDSTKMNHIKFVNRGYLSIYGMNKYLLPCLINYINDNSKEVTLWAGDIKK